jgi:electron-transferring-flavoprotein dehydrogenase
LPFGSPVAEDKVVLLTERKYLAFPAPPPIRSKGCLMVCYGELCRYLAGLCEAQGVEVHSELAAEEPIIDDDRVIGVRLLSGETVLADCVVLGEGSCGLVTGKVIEALGLRRNDRRFDSYALGMKVVVEADGHDADGAAYHTMGYPLGMRRFGGGFVYGIDGRIHIGLVMGLEHVGADSGVHEAFERFLDQPFIRQFVQRGRIVGFGAKVINEGGYHAMPALVGDGVAIVGEAGGLVNTMKLKGIDLAIASGMELGKVIAAGKPLSEYPKALFKTAEFRAFRRARNVHQYFTHSIPAGHDGHGAGDGHPRPTAAEDRPKEGSLGFWRSLPELPNENGALFIPCALDSGEQPRT